MKLGYIYCIGGASNYYLCSLWLIDTLFIFRIQIFIVSQCIYQRITSVFFLSVTTKDYIYKDKVHKYTVWPIIIYQINKYVFIYLFISKLM